MKVKFGGKVSSSRSLIGGSAQGSLLGGTQYIVSSNNVSENVCEDDKYRYFDDIEILDFVMLSGLLVDYNFWSHVASDISINQKFLHPESFKTQSHLNDIQEWTEVNEMKLNYAKSNFIIFTRNQTEFTSRLTLGNTNVEQVKAIKLLGVWITSDLSWDLNCQEMIKKTYARIPLLTKLKYVLKT